MSAPARDPEATTRPPGPKHAAIVAAAAQLFMEHGYGSVSMDAVARAAGVSKATLYAHFASKDRLFASIVGGKCSQVSPVDGAFDEPAEADIRAALSAIGMRLLRFLLAPEVQGILRIVIAESARFPELGAAFLAAGPSAYLARLADWFAIQHRSGRLDIPDPTLAADQFGALLRPLLFLRVLAVVPPAPTEAELQATVDAAVATFLRAYPPGATG
jgi:TetR/AcrR family transcriptional regulator, mexJK operon transcriptional repressor